jgi:hypothetical protein
VSSLSDSIRSFRDRIEAQYEEHPTGCGGSFGEILCFEIHCGDQDELLDFDQSRAKNGEFTGCDFRNLTKKWGISLEFLGELILDHCKKL